MSQEITYTCDHCGAQCSGNLYVSVWGDGSEERAYKHTRLDGCTREHLGLVVAKAFGMPTNAPANSCTDAERTQYETTIELQRKRIAELEHEITNPTKPTTRLVGEHVHELGSCMHCDKGGT
jgi:Cu/Zn superoxide dismutase